jgi:signal transduction histidine kinase
MPVVELNGYMQVIRGIALDPAGFDAAWRAGIRDANGNTSPTPAVYTNRLLIQLPNDARPGYYALAFDSDDMAMDVYVNGEPYTSSVQVAPGGTLMPGYNLFNIDALPQNGVIEMVFAVRAHGMPEGPFSARMFFGEPGAVQDMQLRETGAAAMVMAAYFALALAMAIFWLMANRASRASLYFALLCVSWGLYLSVTLHKALLLIIPGLTWTAGYRIEYVFITIAMLALAHVIKSLLPNCMPRWVLRVVHIAVPLGVLYFTFADTATFTFGKPLYFGLIIICALRIVAAFIHQFKHMERMQRVFIVGFLFLFFATIRDLIMAYTPVGDYMSAALLSQVAMLACVLIQAFAVAMIALEERASSIAREQDLLAQKAAAEKIGVLKDELMSTVSHEIKTPLAVLIGYSQLMHDDLSEQGVSKQTLDDLDTIGSEATRLLRIVEESQQVSAATVLPGERHPVEPGAIIERIARLYEPILARDNTTLTVHIARDLPQINGNSDELTQVIFNLLNNAGKYAQGGEVTLTAEVINGLIRIKVADNGLGIPAQLLPRVLERHVHGDDVAGTGLGLAICREIIEAHGGRIEVHSAHGEGTSVVVMLPVEGSFDE